MGIYRVKQQARPSDVEDSRVSRQSLLAMPDLRLDGAR
jgi:hypothetical protein